MAERYGGRHSPENSRPAAQQPVPRPPQAARPLRLPTVVMLFTALPFVLGAFRQPQSGMIRDLVAAGLIALAAWLTHEGVRAQAEYDARRVARRPAFPRKLAGSVLMGLALGIGAWQDAILPPVLIGLIAAGLHGFAFGPDPLRDKGMEGIDPFQQDRVARVTAEAEGYLAGMRGAIARAGDRGLEMRVARLEQTAREMIRTLEEDPRDLTSARKYLGVYLMGARDATAKFADLWAQAHSPEARRDYEALLDDLERNFAAQRAAMLRDDKTDLDIEIGVLRDRLAREGLAQADTAPTAGHGSQ